MKRKPSTTAAAPLFTPTDLRFEDVPWATIEAHPDFASLGLCTRHTSIDQTGRDWYGLPLLEDAEAAPLQGIPYVVPFTNADEKALNNVLWQIEFLSQRENAPTERARYNAYVRAHQAGQTLHSPADFLEQRVRLDVRTGLLPSPELARYYIPAQSIAEMNALEAQAEAVGQRFTSHAERFYQLDYVGQVLYILVGQARNIRQRLYFVRLAAEHRTAQYQAFGLKTATSQAHWQQVDAQRERQRVTRANARRAGGTPLVPAPPQQLAMFEQAA